MRLASPHWQAARLGAWHDQLMLCSLLHLCHGGRQVLHGSDLICEGIIKPAKATSKASSAPAPADAAAPAAEAAQAAAGPAPAGSQPNVEAEAAAAEPSAPADAAEVPPLSSRYASRDL